jgi:hypothetical protein
MVPWGIDGSWAEVVPDHLSVPHNSTYSRPWYLYAYGSKEATVEENHALTGYIEFSSLKSLKFLYTYIQWV